MAMNLYDIDTHNLPKMLDIVELIMQYPDKKNGCKTKDVKDVYSTVCPNDTSDKRMVKYCYDLVLKCIANHRYEEAAKLYPLLCQDKSILDYILLKVGTIVLMNLDINEKNECFLNFFRSLLNFNYILIDEILLEFTMCALKCEFQDIPRQVKELTSRRILSKTKKHDKIHSIFDAYLILLEWSKVFCGDMNVSQSQTNKEFAKLKKYTEDSDIFILQLVKILELCDKQSEVENELLKYVECNPNNVNALIYICTYLYHRHPNSSKLIDYLEILAERCISDVRTLWLIEIWEERGESLLKILNYCFMFLDYPTNGKNVKAWKALWKNLTEAHQNFLESDIKNIYSLWESRKRSWTWMYFNPRHLPDMQSKEKLIAYKVAFLFIFTDGKEYIEKVSKCHPDSLELAKSLRN